MKEREIQTAIDEIRDVYLKEIAGWSITHEYIDIDSKKDFLFAEKYLNVKSNAIHKNLYPIPYMGNLKKAKWFFLLTNPGCNLNEYRDEGCEKFKAELENNWFLC